MPAWNLSFTTVLLMLFCFVSWCNGQDVSSSAIKVSVRFEADHWQLYRGGEPYEIKGAGGPGPLDMLAEYGGNSSRTWGVGPDTLARLNEAHANGISVTVGIWLEHQHLGFDYQDFVQVSEQIEKVMAAVRKYKHHPALLMWGVGNEMEGYGNGDNPAIWHHVDHLCRLIKEEDPNHPTMTVIAEIGGNRVAAIHKFCPNVDVIGINSYGGAKTLPERYRKAGGQKPYVVTEFGPLGPWEVGRDAINAVPEPHSNVKAESYRKSYLGFERDSKRCLGSYAFLWGQKMEATKTWFGMLLQDQRRTNMVETMSSLWTGQTTENRTPQIKSLVLQGANEVAGGTELEFLLEASDPNGDSIQVEWQLLPEADAYITAGAFKVTPEHLKESIVSESNDKVIVRAPEISGIYRLYAVVDDGSGSVATANVPFRVELQPIDSPGKKQSLPIVLYDEPNQNSPFNMPLRSGDVSQSNLDMNHTDEAKFGTQCICLRSDAGARSEVQLVGEQPVDLMGASRLYFWAKGTTGKEKLIVGIGSDSEETFSDEKTIDLRRHWRKFQLDFSNVDLRKIRTGVRWTLESSDEDATIYLDRIGIE